MTENEEEENKKPFSINYFSNLRKYFFSIKFY